MKTRDELMKLTENYVTYRELLSTKEHPRFSERLRGYTRGISCLTALEQDLMSTAIENCSSEILKEYMELAVARFQAVRLELIRGEYMPEGTDDIVLVRKP